jgi:hypothetical protein
LVKPLADWAFELKRNIALQGYGLKDIRKFDWFEPLEVGRNKPCDWDVEGEWQQ